MKSHERLQAEALVERLIERELVDEGLTDDRLVYKDRTGDYLIEIKAHYLGSKSKRLIEWD